jgi:3D-(3,5/4)-trihydroxycyclohexane-1,2-dione acylhydrolase (decyclizing)
VLAAEWNAAVDTATTPGDQPPPADAQVVGAANRTAGPDGVVVCAAGGLGSRVALPEREVFVMVGDGSDVMTDSEVRTSVMLGKRTVVAVLDNRGYGCINRLQQAGGGAPFNNLSRNVDHRVGGSWIDFAAHARGMGAVAEKVESVGDLELALERAKASDRTYVVVIDTDPLPTTEEGGAWWDVAVPEVSRRPQVEAARGDYERARAAQARG